MRSKTGNNRGGGLYFKSGRVGFTHTYHDIISVENLLEAWKEFRRGKRNKLDVLEFQSDLIYQVTQLHEELKTKTYHHAGYHAFKISDPKPRDIHKASVRDRLLHHAIYRVLYPYFDTKFIHDSYSCRRGKGTHKALERFNNYDRIVSKNHTRTCWVLKCDIKKFFASIDQAILLDILQKHIQDPDILWLLREVIRSFCSCCPQQSHSNILQNVRMSSKPPIHQLRPIGQHWCRHQGLPLGNLTSQLLVNIYMNEFDQYVKHDLKAKHYIRYADDFVILSHDKVLLQSTLGRINTFLQENLKLTLHPTKVSIATVASGVDFLGWVYFTDHRVLRTATKRRMFRRLQERKGSKGEEATKASYVGMLKWGNGRKLAAKIGAR